MCLLLFCFLSILIFLHHWAFFFSNHLSKLCQLTAIFSISSLKFINHVFLGLSCGCSCMTLTENLCNKKGLYTIKELLTAKGRESEGLGWSVQLHIKAKEGY